MWNFSAVYFLTRNLDTKFGEIAIELNLDTYKVLVNENSSAFIVYLKVADYALKVRKFLASVTSQKLILQKQL